MATYTSAGLTNGGRTAHYQFSYDTTLAASPANPTGPEPARTNAVIAACESDYNQMSSWFGGGLNVTGMTVQVTIQSNGASWSGPPTSAQITLKPAGFSFSNSSVYLRYLLYSEVSEIFMKAQNAGWYVEGHNEGSMGEGLSRFLAAEFLRVANAPVTGGIESAYAVTPIWLNGTRPDFIDTDPDDNQPDQVTGCTACFICYLHYQLGYTINQIISAGASNMAGVYQKLTGQTGAWTNFLTLVNSHYPPGQSVNIAWDNIYPVSDLSDFWPPNQITTGYLDGVSSRILLDNPAAGPLVISLTSDNPTVVTVPATVTFPVGFQSMPIPIQAVPIAGPFPPKFVNLVASYAGKTLTAQIEVVPPAVSLLTLTPTSVVCGNSSQGVVTVNLPSKVGAIVVNLVSAAPGFATVPAQVTIPQGQTVSPPFVITTPNIQIPFSPAHSDILASYGPSSYTATLNVNPSVVAGILQSLTLFPTSVQGGAPSRGTVALEQAVPTDTLVGLAVSSGIVLRAPSNSPSLASVPESITIPAGRTAGGFEITTKQPASRQTETVTIMAGAVTVKYAMLTVTS